MAGVGTQAQRIECFHLVFLQVFLAGMRRDRCILKGGANLRYFFDSVRYSNDIDLDCAGPSGWELEPAVDAVLNGPALTRTLRSSGIAIEEGSVSKPKQTDTTRRWRLCLVLADSTDGSQARTTIEFSQRRDGSDDVVLEAVPNAVVRPYGVIAPLITHYGLVPAINQKIAALAERSETKARDVFDLDLLFRRYGQLGSPPPLGSGQATGAVDRALGLSDLDFDTQVAPFLDAELADIYGAPGGWEQMREYVVERLMELDGATGDGRLGSA